jgi:hypothetical protein
VHGPNGSKITRTSCATWPNRRSRCGKTHIGEQRREIKSDIGVVDTQQDHHPRVDLCDEIVGKVNLGQMAYLQVFRRLPNPDEALLSR